MKENKITEEEMLAISAGIKHKTNLMFLVSRCCDLICWDIENDLRKINNNYKLQKEVKMRFSQYNDTIDKASAQFENFIDPITIGAGSAEGFRDYEKTRQFANELVRLLMLYYEKCRLNLDNHVQLFELLENFDGGSGVFAEADINKFDLGTKK